MVDTAKAEIEGDTRLIVTRDFAAPPERLFHALTAPDILPQWMVGPPGWTLTVETMDWRPGGTYNWLYQEPSSGNWFAFTGEVRGYDPPHGFICTQAYDPGNMGVTMGAEMLVEHAITAMDTGARLRVTMSFATAEDRAAAMATGMTDGMEMSYAALDGLLVA